MTQNWQREYLLPLAPCYEAYKKSFKYGSMQYAWEHWEDWREQIWLLNQLKADRRKMAALAYDVLAGLYPAMITEAKSPVSVVELVNALKEYSRDGGVTDEEMRLNSKQLRVSHKELRGEFVKTSLTADYIDADNFITGLTEVYSWVCPPCARAVVTTFLESSTEAEINVDEVVVNSLLKHFPDITELLQSKEEKIGKRKTKVYVPFDDGTFRESCVMCYSPEGEKQKAEAAMKIRVPFPSIAVTEVGNILQLYFELIESNARRQITEAETASGIQVKNKDQIVYDFMIMAADYVENNTIGFVRQEAKQRLLKHDEED